MRTEFVYSFIALGIIPVTVNAADVQATQISTTVLQSANGALTLDKVKLVPGKYIFKASLTSKVYGVNVMIDGKVVATVDNSATAQDLTIDIDLSDKKEETEVEISFVSTDPNESGADFTLGAPVVDLSFDFGAPKNALVNNAEQLAGTISGYSYAAKQEDVDAANALKTKAENIEESYDVYKKYKLYLEKSTIQDEIDALADQAAKAEAAYQNEQAYNRVNAAITAIKAKYNSAVAELEAALVNQAAYLLDAAKADLNDNINKKITAATSASYASYQAGTAVADEATNTGMVPTEDTLNTIVDNWKNQGTATQAAYNALHKVVTDLQASLNAVQVADASLTATFATERAAAQKAIDDINTKVENAKNSAAQLTLNVDSDKSAAEGKINTLAGKVTTANAEFNANKATTEAIAAVQKAYNDAKTAVDAKKSKDGKYPDKDYYATYLKTQQDAINKLTSDAAAAYKVDGTGTAQAYNAALNTANIETAIDDYKTNAIAAVEKYDDLQDAIADYQQSLDAARAQVAGLAVYEDANYDYKTKFDLIQKRINDVKKAITAAQGKVDAEHWDAMLAIDADAAITSDIATLISTVQADQNQYDADFLDNGMTTLEDKIAEFQAKDASVLGADANAFQSVETEIETAYNAVKAAKDAIDTHSDFVDYTGLVGTSSAAWHGNNGPAGQVEKYGDSKVGNKLYQEIEVENGTYDIVVKATSYNERGEDGASLAADATDVAYVFGNSAKTWITAKKGSGTGLLAGDPAEYTIKGAVVTDGKLTIGLALDKAGQTGWHTIQIVSLKAETASLIQKWGAEIAELNAQQEGLETLANEIAAKVTANNTAKAQNQTNIDNLQTAMGTFETTYKIGQADSPLGNRGKAGGSVTKEVGEINTALGTLEANNAAVDVTAITKVDNTAKVGTGVNEWAQGEITHNGAASRTTSKDNVTFVEQWKPSTNENNALTGTVITQSVTNLPNGFYDVELYAYAADQASGNPNNGKTDIAVVYANDATAPITVTTTSAANVHTLNNVLVSDGVLNLGLKKVKGGTNWHGIQIKSLTYHENTNSVLSEYNAQYLALAAHKTTLDNQAPAIKSEVEANAATNTAATKAVTDLQAAELATLKSLKNVTNAEAVSDDATAKKTDPADFKVFETGLAADKSYTAKKTAIDADITAMQAAIAASNAEETLASKWQNNSITVVTGKDAKNNDITKTYSVAEITAAINALKAEAETESANWEAYKALQDNNMSKLLPDTITMDATIAGAEALAYYQGLKNSYITGKANILTAMQTSLTQRKAVADKSSFEQQIADLIAKVQVVKSDAEANLKKYNEQKTAAKETQTLWNQTYTEIAATDHSSKVQDYLDELDAIQVTLTDAANTVEDSYKAGKSVAEAKDFAAIKTSINDVKARQSESYSEFVTADNKAAHESFMGNETTKGAIQLATEAYQKAVQERAEYSSTNDDIKAAVEAAAATLDEMLYECPNQLAELTAAENAAYEATVSPTVFDVDPFNTQATQIQQDITNALSTFKTDVKSAIQDYWTPKKANYTAKVTAAENDIAGYSDKAKKNAFKDVKKLIAAGDAAVNETKLAGVESAINSLENIDAMLAADKDAAADKDITALTSTVDAKYNEVKTYINGVTNNISAKAEQLEVLEGAYGDDVAYVKTLAKTFDNHDGIVDALNGFIATANDCKTAVETAVANDNANTAAYNEMVAAISPVEAKLAEAKAAVAPYKYETSFETEEDWLNSDKEWADDAKTNGYAVDDKQNLVDEMADLSDAIENTLTIAFGTEKAGLSADVAELKNQFNAYVANNGLDETATAFKTAIDDLETALGNAAIKDIDEPADGIQYDEILDATAKLIALQKTIADTQSALLTANASTANADVLADFNAQMDALAETASLEGYDEWVANQPYGETTLDAAITDLQTQITDLKAAIAAEENISFYKDQYQAQIDAIETALTPVAAQITAKDAQFKANAVAYEALSAQINELQGKIDAAKEKVGAYEYAANNYFNLIENYWNGELYGGAQYTLNTAKAQIETANNNKTLTDASVVANKADIENNVQNYLDRSANAELNAQRGNLRNLLASAIDYKYEEQKYSSALWARLVAEKDGINTEINDLDYAIWDSYQTYESYGKWDPKYDDEGNTIAKAVTSDADYAAQMEIVNAIKAKIETLSTAVDELALLGDANVDGKVNVLDYQKVLNMILDPTIQPEVDSDLFANIDINQSEVIEVGDLTAIVNYILNGEWQGYAAAPSRNFANNESLAMNMTSLENGKQRIAVSLANVNDYTAFQLDVVLPNGMTIVSSSLTDRAGESHKLYSRAQLDGSIRMLASSVKGETFKGNEGAVLFIDVQTNSEYMGGQAELLNILFSNTEAGVRSFRIGEQSTGIETVSTFEALKQKVYDLSGRLTDGLKKGVNIIRRADGSTQKVMK